MPQQKRSGAPKRAVPSSRKSPATPPPVRRPVAGPPPSSLKARINRALPPFTTQRYIAIWVLGMIPLVILLLVLVQCGSPASTTAGATPIAQEAGGNPTPGANLAPLVETPTSASTPGSASSSANTPAASGASDTPGASGGSQPATAASGSASSGGDKYFVIETEKGRIVARLHTEASAGVGKTISNFEQKAGSGYFNNLTFHRVEEWVIQGGDPQGTGTGGGEMPSEYNKLPFKAGALGVARRGDPAINNDSQFFIVKSDADYLNGQYTNFGQVEDADSMAVVNKIVVGDKITRITVQDHK